MHDSVPMRFRQRQPDLVQHVRHQGQRYPWMFLLKIRERLPVQILHHQVRHVAALAPCDPEIRDVDDVRMPQPSARLCLPLEPRQKMRIRRPLGRDDLDRNHPRRPQMRREIDSPHPTRPKLLIDAVLAVESFADHEAAMIATPCGEARINRHLGHGVRAPPDRLLRPSHGDSNVEQKSSRGPC